MMKDSKYENSDDQGVPLGKRVMDIKKVVTENSNIDSYDKTYIFVSSTCTKVMNFLKTLQLEVLIFIFIFSYTVKSVTSITLIMEKICRVDMGYDDRICSHLHEEEFKRYKTEVETSANDFHLYHTLIALTPSAILSIFIGPWSDKYGRKPPLIVGLVGGLVEGVGITLCGYYVSSSVNYYLIPPVFSGLFGGFVATMTVFYSYASDVTDASSRTFKYSLLEVALGIGIPLGALAGGWIFKFWGYVPVFSCTIIGNIFGIFWVVFFIKETRGLHNKDRLLYKIKNLFSLARVIDGFKATTKPRPNKGRAQIWMLLLAMSIAFMAMTTQSIAYIYAYEVFGWSNTKYSTVSAFFSVIGLITVLVAVPVLTKVLKLGDPTLGIIGSVSMAAKNLVTGIATYGEWIYFLANLLGLLTTLATVAGRSRISKIVSKNDLGKVFAFISSAESILPIIASIFVTRLYNAAVKSGNAGITYYAIAFILAFDLFIFIWLACLPTANYEEMNEEKEKRHNKDKEETVA